MGVPQVIGRYEIIAELGRGAMGSVFKAKDPAVGRTVALKTILSAALAGGQSDEYRARFYREAQASGALAHPGIVPVFDVGENDGIPFLVMEFVDGRTLDTVIKKGERFSLDRVCEIGQQIAEALGYAHRQGVIHRDIKPANILLTSREIYGSERPRITDFGIAKLAASEITTTGQLLGTPSFMPPEQFTGMPIDGRADLFSLGVILYAMATGEQPFAGETMTAVSYKVVYTDPIPPAKLNPAIPPRLEAVILKCLAKNPAERYQTGEEIAQDLAAIRANTGTALSLAVPFAGASDATLGPGLISGTQFPAQTHSGLSATLPSGTAPFATVAPLPTSAQPNLKKGPGVAAIVGIAAIGLAVLGAGAFFLLHSRSPQPGPPTATTPPHGAPTVQQPIAPGAPPASVPAAAPATPPKQPAGAPLIAPASSTVPPANPAAQQKPGATPATPAAPAKTPFDPRKADANTNARLKIDVGKFPSGIPFSVEMNHQTYLHFIVGDGSSLDNLFVPPGVQEFRLSFRSNGQEFDSNVLTEEFKVKKKKTLKLQLMVKGKAASKITQPIEKDAQLFLSVSTSFADNLPF